MQSDTSATLASQAQFAKLKAEQKSPMKAQSEVKKWASWLAQFVLVWYSLMDILSDDMKPTPVAHYVYGSRNFSIR
jgi:hypothetical protein